MRITIDPEAVKTSEARSPREQAIERASERAGMRLQDLKMHYLFLLTPGPEPAVLAPSQQPCTRPILLVPLRSPKAPCYPVRQGRLTVSQLLFPGQSARYCIVHENCFCRVMHKYRDLLFELLFVSAQPSSCTRRMSSFGPYEPCCAYRHQFSE